MSNLVETVKNICNNKPDAKILIGFINKKLTLKEKSKAVELCNKVDAKVYFYESNIIDKSAIDACDYYIRQNYTGNFDVIKTYVSTYSVTKDHINKVANEVYEKARMDLSESKSRELEDTVLNLLGEL